MLRTATFTAFSQLRSRNLHPRATPPEQTATNEILSRAARGLTPCPGPRASYAVLPHGPTIDGSHAGGSPPGTLATTRVYCGGDLVGYGPWPNEVCRLIAARGIPTIYGNYDYAIAA